MIVRVTGPDNIRPVLYQWDVGQVIYIDGVSDAATVNFEMPNMDRALVVHVETSGDRHIAKVPNFTLQYAGWIVVSVFEQDGDVGTTVCREKLLIKPRQKPQDYTYEENIGYTNWVTKSAEAEELLSDLTDEWEQLKEDIESGHYKGDKGETGQTGATGPQGPPGPQGLPGTTTWSGITDKPTAFTPSTHQHTQNDVSGLVAALANKSDNNHNHTAEEVSFDTEAEYQDGTVGSGLTTAFGEIAKLGGHVIAGRVSSLNDSEIVSDHIIDSFGSPAYIGIDDIVQYSAYGIEEPGWYVFTRITSADGENVAGVTVIGADGFIISGNHVDIAVRFGASPESKKVTINWGAKTETFLFRATDLAIRNLDQRVTFYVYDISDFLTWEWTPATDTTAVADKIYYDENHNKIELAVDDPVPSGSVIHSKCIIEGFTRNISYSSPLIDCPVEIYVPEIEDNGYGAWFEIQASFAAAYSVTVIPPEGVSVSTTFVQSPDKGINMLDLQYHISTKTWMVANNKWKVS